MPVEVSGKEHFGKRRAGAIPAVRAAGVNMGT